MLRVVINLPFYFVCNNCSGLHSLLVHCIGHTALYLSDYRCVQWPGRSVGGGCGRHVTVARSEHEHAVQVYRHTDSGPQ